MQARHIRLTNLSTHEVAIVDCVSMKQVLRTSKIVGPMHWHGSVGVV